jgi:hypothetical protein
MLVLINCGGKEKSITISIPDGSDRLVLVLTGAYGEIGVFDPAKVNIKKSTSYFIPLSKNGTVVFDRAVTISTADQNYTEPKALVAKAGYKYNTGADLGLKDNTMVTFLSDDVVIIFVSEKDWKTVSKENVKRIGIVEKLGKYEIKTSSPATSDDKKLKSITLDGAVTYYQKKGFKVNIEISIPGIQALRNELGGDKFAFIMDNLQTNVVAAILVEFASEEDFNKACTTMPVWKSMPKRGLVGLFNPTGKTEITTLFESMK